MVIFPNKRHNFPTSFTPPLAIGIKSFALSLLSLVLILLAVSCKPRTEALVGRLQPYPAFYSEYIGERQIDVWVPDDYPKEAPYAVIYMHDGESLFDARKTWNGQEWGVDQVLTKLRKAEKIRPVIVVSIWNARRFRRAEYMPQKAFESLPPLLKDSLYEAEQKPDWPLFPKRVYSDDYLKFITGELKPFIDEHYQVDAARENTFIMGSSMGGLISMYAMLEYPDIFGGAGCLSTHWYGLDRNNEFMGPALLCYLDERLIPPGKHKWYFDYGTETADQYYELYQLQADGILKAKGYDDKNWLTLKFEGHKHEEDAWRSRLHIPMEFLLQ